MAEEWDQWTRVFAAGAEVASQNIGADPGAVLAASLLAMSQECRALRRSEEGRHD